MAGKREDERADKNVILVSSPHHPQHHPWLHPVSGLGLELLALTEREGDRHMLHQLYFSGITNSSLLVSLGALASRQTEHFSNLEASGEISCLNRCTFCRDQVGFLKNSLKKKRYLILRKIVTC